MSKRLPWVLLGLGSAALLVAGWWTFWFLCDDAYIAFRYVHNAHVGRGLVWNWAPFRPVEGYTSFLWVMLLWGVWAVTGRDPTQSANPLSLGFALGTLGVLIATAKRVRLSDAIEPYRVPFAALSLFGILSNRTFLTWTTSGLETSLETFLVLSWTLLAVFAAPGTRATALLATVASLMALCRPDGLLFCAFTGLLVLVRARREGPRELAALAPFAAVVAHALWRWSTYGYWLPNTYTAKHIGPWPLAGVAYLGAFLLEYAFYVWLAVALLWLWRSRRDWRAIVSPAPANLGASIAVVAVLSHFAYYTFNVGGDHFEFRIYQHLVPLIVLSFPWLAARLGWSPRRLAVTLGTMLLVGLFLPWTHWWYSSDLPPKAAMERIELRDRVPLALWPYAAAYDGLQMFLTGHFIGLRHCRHRGFVLQQARDLPTRQEGLGLDGGENPVAAYGAIGLVGWTLPNVFVIDRFGLNDLVGARTPAIHTSQFDRMMAHDRRAPKAYIACFQPNVSIGLGSIKVTPRDEPLTDDAIRACETTWLARVVDGS